MRRIAFMTVICAFIAAPASAGLIASGSVSPLPNGPQAYSFGPFAAPLSADDGIFSIHARGDFFIPGDDAGEVLNWNINDYFGTDIVWSGGSALNEGQIGTASSLDMLIIRNSTVATTSPPDDIEWARSIVIPRATLNDIIGAGPLTLTVDIDYPSNVSLNQYTQGPAFMDFALSYTPATAAGAPTVPAPGAILLGSIGVAVVGWLRTRKTL